LLGICQALPSYWCWEDYLPEGGEATSSVEEEYEEKESFVEDGMYDLQFFSDIYCICSHEIRE
jgi:hypothetical protein